MRACFVLLGILEQFAGSHTPELNIDRLKSSWHASECGPGAGAGTVCTAAVSPHTQVTDGGGWRQHIQIASHVPRRMGQQHANKSL